MTKILNDKILLICFLIALVYFQLLATPTEIHFIGYQPLAADRATECHTGLLHPDLSFQAKTFGTYREDEATDAQICKSLPLPMLSRNFEISYVGSPSNQVYVQLITENSPKPVIVDLPPLAKGESPNKWRKKTLTLPDIERSQLVSFKIVDRNHKDKDAWLIIRSRIDFYADPSLLEQLRNAVSIKQVKIITAVILALLFSTLVFRNAFRNSSDLIFLLGVITLSVLIHLRLENFFLWDDWSLLDKFNEKGWSGLFFSYNGHFMPIYFAFFYGVSKIFGSFYSGYLLITCLLHALNSFLVYRFICLLTNSGDQNSKWVAKILSVIYCFSALHLEALQGATSYCFYLNQLFCFLGLFSAIKYLRENNSISFFLTVASLFLAPLSFGNGLALFPQILLLGAVIFYETSANRAEIFKRLFRIFKYGIAITSILLACYFGFKEEDKNAPPLSESINHLPEIASYVATGSQFGTILRGLSFYPATEISNSHQFLPLKLQHFLAYHKLPAEIAYAAIGFLVSALILFFSLLISVNKKNTFWLWFFAELSIVLFFIFPAIGRWHIGISQSLSLRYQYSPLIFLMLMIFPVISWAVRYRTTKWIFAVWLLVFSFFQFHLLQQDNQYTLLGVKNRAFVDQLVDWQKIVTHEAEKAKKLPSYQGTGLDVHGLYPIGAWTLAPERTGEDILNTLKKIDPEKFRSPKNTN